MNSQLRQPKKAGITRGVAPKPSVPPPAKKALGAAASHVVFARLVDHATGKPFADIDYEVVDATGKVVASGKTDHTGTIHHDVAGAGKYQVRRAAKPLPPRGKEGPEEQAVYALVDHATEKPLAGARYRILDEAGKLLASGTSDSRGIVNVKLPAGATHYVRLP